jgi:hypothetical protein
VSRTAALSKAVTVTLDGSGHGTVSAGPAVPGESWPPPYTISVRASSNTAEAQCSVSVAGQFLAATTWGSTGDSNSDGALTLYPGTEVSATWTGGDPGATATLTVTGQRQVP